MPDTVSTASVLVTVQRRWRWRSIALSMAAGGVVFALTLIVALAIFDAARVVALSMAAVFAMATAAAVAWRSPRLTAVAAAREIERQTPGLDNLIVTAAEIEERPRPVSADIRDEIVRQAQERASRIDAHAIVPLAQPLVVAGLVMTGCVLLTGIGAGVLPSVLERGSIDGVTTPTGSFEVRITPPAYSRRTVETLRDPARISVLAGSRIQIQAANRDWIASESAAIEFTVGAEPHFLSVMVVPDLPPSIRVVTPGRDTAFREPTGEVAISLQAGDDLGLSTVSLRFTKASGGGENVSFTEGDLALRLERRSEREWLGRAAVSLGALGLADGDILVYRAIARDTNPNGAPVQSDQYLIEIGRHAEIADAGFALPSEEKKYAISQQMVIYKTEQLLATGSTMAADARLDQSRTIAMEQRMVRAEVVFLGGGEVEDEVEEAAKSDELTEGRLQNTGRAEMLRAINAMSRAEAQLNDGHATEALVLEREALAHLERALDRRRFFLRTLPDRSRIDAGRRLTGDRREARPWPRDQRVTVAPASIDEQRRVMRDLAGGAAVNTALAARVAAIDPSSADLQNAAVALASATTAAARDSATRAAMTAITRHALTSLPSSAAVGVRSEPLAGRLADEMRPRP